MSYPLICDPGTGYMKIGFSNYDFPQKSIPSVVGKPMMRSGETVSGVELKSIMVGEEVTPFRSFLDLSYPISEGIVSNWDEMELVFGHAFNSVNAKPKETSLLLTEAIMNPLSNREKMAELMFEKFGFEKLTMQVQAILSLYAEALTTSLILDAGDGVSHLIPVYQGVILKPFITRLNLAGRHITSYLLKLLFLRGYSFNSSADFETVREIKEKMCFVSADLEVDRMLGKETTTLDKSYRLPDGKKIRIGRERFEAPELLFQPWLGGFDFNGISESVFDCINV